MAERKKIIVLKKGLTPSEEEEEGGLSTRDISTSTSTGHGTEQYEYEQRTVKRARLTRSISRLLVINGEPKSKVQRRFEDGNEDGSRTSSSSGRSADSLFQQQHGVVPNGRHTPPVIAPLPASQSRLPALLDLTSLPSHSHSQISLRFGQIARSLFHEHILDVSSETLRVEYELLEVEFYLRQEGHEDPFAHGTVEQSVQGRWYFHRAPRKSEDPTRSATALSGYRGGTRKGVDLTFGGPVSATTTTTSSSSSSSSSFIQDASGPRGGILLRSMRRLSDGAVISGPSLLVDELLRVCGCTSIAALVGEALANDTSAFGSTSTTPVGLNRKKKEEKKKKKKECAITIRPRTAVLGKKPTVYTSPRIGLELSHPGTTTSPSDARILFIQKPYRFFIHPTLLRASGRAQTFLGIYTLLRESEILGERSVLEEVARLTGITDGCVRKYAGDLRCGRESGEVRVFIGSAGKGVSSSPSMYLKMMGSLGRERGG